MLRQTGAKQKLSSPLGLVHALCVCRGFARSLVITHSRADTCLSTSNQEAPPELASLQESRISPVGCRSLAGSKVPIGFRLAR